MFFLGISLSMAEASVAAPFTSRNVNISCVPYVIRFSSTLLCPNWHVFLPPREGRATMVSAFASFKFGVAFCFTQLISVLMVFYVSTPCHRHEILFCNLHQSRQGQKTTIVQVEIIDKLYLAIPTRLPTRYKSKALINTILHFLTRLAPSPPTTNTWWSTLALR